MESLKKELEKLPLYLLRQKGREIGVKAPSSLNKRKLIEAIMDVTLGKVKPTASNRGRPVLNERLERVQMPTVTKEDFESRLDKILRDFKNLLLDMFVSKEL